MKQKNKLIRKIIKMLKKDQQVNIPVIDKVHKALSDKSSLYASWHNFTKAHITQWAVLAVIVIAVGGGLYAASQRDALDGLHSDASYTQTRGHRSSEVQRLGTILLDQSKDFQKGDAATKSVISPEMVETAKQRRAIIDVAVKDNQLDVVLQNIISKSEYEKLPEEVQQYVEQEKTVEGKYARAVVEGENETASNIYKVTTKDNQRFALLFDKSMAQPEFITGATVRATGINVNNQLVVLPEEDSTKQLKAASGPSSNNNKKVAIILFNFQNLATQSTTPQQARQDVFGATNSVKDYYSQISNGQINIGGHLNPAGDVFGWYTLPINYVAGSCTSAIGWPPYEWEEQARIAAAADGFVDSNYTNVFYVLPGVCSGFLGIADMPGREVYIDDPSLGVYTHEFGHNLGRAHASAARCFGADGVTLVQMSANCIHGAEYGDAYDVMGSFARMHFMSVPHKEEIPGLTDSWLDSGNIMDISQSTNPTGTYTIASSSTFGPGIKALRIPKNFSFGNGYYYLEFRQPVSYDVGQDTGFTNGVTIRHYSGSFLQTHIIDTHPDAPNSTDLTDAALGVGETFTDPVDGITITTESVGPDGAVVSVNFTSNAPCVRNNPTISVSSNGVFEVNAGQSFAATLTITNNDSQTCPSSTFSLSKAAGVNFGLSYNPTSFIETLFPGQSVTRNFTVTTSASMSDGTYAYQWQAARPGLPTSSGGNLINVIGCPSRPVLSISPTGGQIQVGASGEYVISIRNVDPVGGCAATSTYSLRQTSNQQNISTSLVGTITRTVDAGQQVDVPITVSVGSGFTQQNFSVSFESRREGNPTSGYRSLTANFTAVNCANPTVTMTQASGSAAPGQPASYSFTVRNNDTNASICPVGTYTVSPTNLPSGWSANPATITESIPLNSAITKTIEITAPANSSPGTTQIQLKATRNDTPTVAGTASLSHTVTQVGPVCTESNPTVTISPSQGEAPAGQSVTYAYTVRNNDSAQCAASEFRVLPNAVAPNNLPAGWSANPSVSIDSIAPGAQVTRQFTITSSSDEDGGYYPITYRASKVSNASISGAATFTHKVLGPTSVDGPVTYISSPVNGFIFANGTMPISTSAEVIGGFIQRIEIKLDTRVLKTCEMISYGWGYCDTSIDYYGTKLGIGNHTITATATEYGTGQTSVSTVTFSKITNVKNPPR